MRRGWGQGVRSQMGCWQTFELPVLLLFGTWSLSLSITLYYIILYHIILYYIMLYYIILILYYIYIYIYIYIDIDIYIYII